MRLALFDDLRLGMLTSDDEIADITSAIPGRVDADAIGAGWWVRMCRDFADIRTDLEAAAINAPRRPLADARLLAPALNPSKIVACAANALAHIEEMAEVIQRNKMNVATWMKTFDVFLKAPSSIIGPADDVIITEQHDGHEVHHEGELAVIIGRGGRRIPEMEALDHVVGYTIGLDMTLRADGDRSRRKSYDTFTPLGPWMVTADEVRDHDFHTRLWVNDVLRQDSRASDLIVQVPAIIAHASSVMRLDPGDVILCGAPPGVGPVQPGDVIQVETSGIGPMRIQVRRG